MAMPLGAFEILSQNKMQSWNQEADAFDKLIDATFEKAISDNIVPNPKNSNYVMRFMFPTKASKEVKDILKVRYTEAGWKVIENSDFKDTNYNGYFDFYRK